MKLIKNINVYAPEHLGNKDVLIIGDKIAKIEEAGCMPEIPYLTAEDIIDGSGKILTPGFIDCHVHILGGGGEGGFANRTPEATVGRAYKVRCHHSGRMSWNGRYRKRYVRTGGKNKRVM